MKITYLYYVLGLVLLVVVVLIILLITSVDRYASYWKKQAEKTNLTDPIIYVAMGDSAAQGIGASSPSKGYVGLITAKLTNLKNRPVHMINLSKSGAKLKDVLDNQLPELKKLSPDVITIEIGANDIQSFERDKFELEAEELFKQLPAKAVISDIPFFGGRSRFLDPSSDKKVLQANSILKKSADKHGIKLAPLYLETRKHNQYPWSYAIDYFHPNNLGYKTWADVFWDGIK